MHLYHMPNGLDTDGDTPYISLEGEDSLGTWGSTLTILIFNLVTHPLPPPKWHVSQLPHHQKIRHALVERGDSLKGILVYNMQMHNRYTR